MPQYPPFAMPAGESSDAPASSSFRLTFSASFSGVLLSSIILALPTVLQNVALVGLALKARLRMSSP